MINSSRVTEILAECMFKDDEVIDGKPVPDAIVVEGIDARFWLHKERVKEYDKEITSIVKQLPERFKEGDSFLNMCMTKDGDLWTGFQVVCEQLLVLGLATGNMKYCATKDFWAMMPGGVPYIYVLDREQQNE